MDWRSFTVGAVSGIGSAVAFLVGLALFVMFEIAAEEAAESPESKEFRMRDEPWRC